MIHKLYNSMSLQFNFIVLLILTQFIWNPTTADCTVSGGTVTSCACASSFIDLSSSSVTSFGSNTIFSDCGTIITRISLQNNQLTTLPETIFNDLTSLTYLYLNSNPLTTLPETTFNNLTSLTRLSLQNNQLTTLPETIFNDLTSLTYLSLYNTHLTTLPETIFNGLTSLTHLNLDSNPGASTPCPSGSQYDTISMNKKFCIEIPITPTPSPSATLTSTTTLSTTSSSTLASSTTPSISATPSASLVAKQYPKSGKRSMKIRGHFRTKILISNTTYIIFC